MRVMQHLFALAILCLATLLYGLSSAHVFLDPYDRRYVQDLYDHSQYNYKTAVRTIADDKLYQASALRILENGKIYTINREIPTAGIYLYVAAIYIFNNPYFLNPLVYLLTGYLVYLISRQITSQNRSLMAVALFSLDPLIGSQIGLTMLDLSLVFWILLAIYSTIRSTRTHNPYSKIFFALLCGVAYGFAAGTKVGVFIPALYTVSVWMFIMRRKVLALMIATLTTVLTYTASNLPYVFQTGSLYSLLELEKYRFEFYMQELVPYLPGMAFFGLILPIHWTWWGSGLQLNDSYSILWPVALFAVLYYFSQHYRSLWSFTVDGIGLYIPSLQKKRKWYETSVETDYTLKRRMIYLTVTAMTLLFLHLFIPFWPRYYISLLPVLYLLTAVVLPSTLFTQFRNKMLLGTVVFFQILIILFQLRPSPQSTAAEIATFFQNSAYQDLYTALDSPHATRSTRTEFWRTILNLEHELYLQNKQVQITLPITFPWQDYVEGEITTKLSTQLGDFEHRAKIELVREYNAWKLVWHGEYLLPNYQLGDRIIVEYQIPTDAKILDQQNQVISSYQDWPQLEVIPARISNESALQDQLALLTGLDRQVAREKYRRNSPSDAYVGIGFILDEATSQDINKLQNNPAIRLHNAPKRVNLNGLDQDERKKLQEYLSQHQGDLQATIPATIQIRKSDGHLIPVFQSAPSSKPNIQVTL